MRVYTCVCTYTHTHPSGDNTSDRTTFPMLLTAPRVTSMGNTTHREHVPNTSMPMVRTFDELWL